MAKRCEMLTRGEIENAAKPRFEIRDSRFEIRKIEARVRDIELMDFA